ncbi:MAG: acylphosphatase [Candidatus Omnitrophota bacterium]|jgi:acylphosphatase|nr:MAG: acylphosphatase [Candidatus Omnitrophota bacterium]
MNKNKRIHAFVSGRVQGVGFRYFVERRAQSLGLVGEVRNLGDGRVEVVAEGEEATLKELIAILQRGPSALAHVASVDVQWSEAFGRHRDFSIAF